MHLGILRGDKRVLRVVLVLRPKEEARRDKTNTRLLQAALAIAAAGF